MNNFSYKWNDCVSEYMNDYTPNEDDKCILIDRIESRILSSPKTHFRYYKKNISKEEAIKILKYGSKRRDIGESRD